MFTGRRPQRGPTGPQKGEDLVHPLRVNLEDLYNGKILHLAINRDKFCQACEGRGGSRDCEKDCEECHGHGVRLQLRQIGPGMVQQIQTACNACQGKGKIIEEKDQCPECLGKKTCRERKVLEVVIEKGMKNGSKIRLSGEGDELPGTTAGDVIFVVQEKEHETFQRKGADLLMTMELELSEALCGFAKTICHLDERSLKIESPVGKVIRPDSVHCIQGEGMPYPGNPFTKGRLFISFKVNFPKTMSSTAITSLLSVLSSSKGSVVTPTPDQELEECSFEEVDFSEFGRGNESVGTGGGDEAYDEDERGGGGGGGMQCQSS
jgi:DnaJ homolog subfamily A member 2